MSTPAPPAILAAASAKLCQNETCVNATTTFAVNEPYAQFTGALVTAASGPLEYAMIIPLE